MFKRKPLWVIHKQAEEGGEHKVYDLLSLLAVGIGGTIGSGIFVLSGAISRTAAGPATVISWLLAGLVSMITALAYAELGCRIPSPGSTYNFAYVGLGELFGVLGAWFLTLEYGFAGAAVARSWGDKVAYYAGELDILGCTTESPCWLNRLGGTNLNISAAFICILSNFVLMRGVNLGRIFLNVLVFLKVSLVIFVIVVGYMNFDSKNLSPFIPPHSEPTEENPEPVVGGFHGVFLGATIAFFGYIGFDEVACLSAEATNPRRDIPLAILGTLFVVALLYLLASLALVGMVPYTHIHESEGFGSAFRHVGAHVAMHVVMIGQIAIVLPAVVLVSFLPQSRLLGAVGRDGLLPNAFTRIDDSGNFVVGVVFSACVMTTIALLVPFRELNDLISGGIILSFILTNTSLIMVRLERTWVSNLVVTVYNSVAFATALVWTKTDNILATAALVLLLIVVIAFLGRQKRANLFEEDGKNNSEGFKVPGVPYVPAIAIFSNYCMLAQLSRKGFTQLGILFFVAIVPYLIFRAHNYFSVKHIAVSRDEDQNDMTIDGTNIELAAI
mmetsp:Transcript_13449/g.24063  ORF Transcript_13449/g.24063 Transcript_13449/m.24063 type:complete len:557 (+) Transcript_13449:286-1956(+)